MIVEVRKTYKYRLYRNDKCDRHLHDAINISGIIWNHCIALQRRYYRLMGGYISIGRLKKHIANRRNSERYNYWRKVGSQAVQDIIERLDKSYQVFFKKQGGRPSFGKVKKYRSFTLKQAGWKLLGGNKIRLGKTIYKFVKHREIGGTIKTVTVKRDTIGRLWLCFSVIENISVPAVSTGETGGFDFGLKTFLTDNNGKGYMSPEYFKQELNRIKHLNRSLSHKRKGSRNRAKTKYLLARTHIRIDDKRKDFHYQLAHDLCDRFDVLVFEDLNMEGMKRLWGLKVSDLGFSQFIEIVQWVATKRGKQVIFIDRFEPSTQICSHCGNKQKLTLADRTYSCPCGLILDRDHNAAINIQRIGASMHTARGVVSPA
ncbi:MAG: transposase [Phototrophicaceae bacterium]